MKEHIIIFSTVFAVFGVILVSGALYMVPYTVRESFRVDKAKTLVDDAFVLMPFGNKTYIPDTIFYNMSIVQINVDSSDRIVSRIISHTTGKVYFEIQTMLDETLCWTPPFPGAWQFVFHNPSSTQMNATVRIAELYLKLTEDRDVTYYHSLLDPIYGYSGIGAIIVAVGLNVIHLSREAKRQGKNQAFSS